MTESAGAAPATAQGADTSVSEASDVSTESTGEELSEGDVSEAKDQTSKSMPDDDSDEPREGESLDDFIDRISKKGKKAKKVKDEPEAKEGDADPEPETEKKEPPKPEKKVLKLKVDGEEIDYDVSNESDLVQRLQKSFTADQRLEKAAKLHKQSEAFVKALKNNPFQVLSHPSLGIENLHEAAEKFLWGKIQREKMTPEERQLQDDQAELERLRTIEAKRVEAEKSQREEAQKAAIREKMQADLIAALDQSGVPRNDWSVRRMASLMKAALANGVDVSAAEVAQRVKAEYIENYRNMIQGMTPDQIIETFGEDAAKKILDHQIKKVETNTPFPTQSKPTQSNTQSSATQRRRLTSPYDLLHR